jgi:hypothetical protein
MSHWRILFLLIIAPVTAIAYASAVYIVNPIFIQDARDSGTPVAPPTVTVTMQPYTGIDR